ncbi:sigma-70 family RNA polymerase sigma factor [uncultured Rubinisphaera sp.]|uniref:RNA polymerase sigma factor n=1 Tax=uncultured Rubinisphaera sp. TaxID=1678686 RepID=UPI0030D9774F
MSAEHEKPSLILGIEAGNESAAREVFDRYLVRLIALARSRLSEKLARKVDADDIVQSAFRSFFVRAREGQFKIERGADLWNLLATITKCKLLKKAEHYKQQKRSLDRDQPITTTDSMEENLFTADPTEIEAVALTDELEFLMQSLEVHQRQMLELRLQGLTTLEIADEVERSERTVRRFLGNFRDQLETRLNMEVDNA